jgi:hypothetical protein
MTRDHLDDAIDHVATLLVRVEDNDGLSTRILASLPDRSPWLLHSWIPRLAMTAALACGVSLVVLRPFDERSTVVLRTERSSAPFVEFQRTFRQTFRRTLLDAGRTFAERPSERSSERRRTVVERPSERSSERAGFRP